MLKFLNEDLMKFTELPDEIIGAIVRLCANEKDSIQYWSPHYMEWKGKDMFSPFSYDGIYRIKPIPMPELVIPWELIHPRWKYLAIGASGEWFCEQKPIPNKYSGFIISPDRTYNDTLVFNNPEGTTPFEYFGHVIVERPE